MHILRRLDSIRETEHAATVDLIEALVECDHAAAHLDAGYPSVFQLLVQRLGYTAGAASRRFAAVRCARRSSRVLEMLRARRTSLCALAKIERALRDADDVDALLDRSDGASVDEVERIAAAARPRKAKPRELVRQVAVGAQPSHPATARASSTMELALDEGNPANEPPDARAHGPEDRVHVSFSLTANEFERLQRFRARLSRTRSTVATLEEAMIALLDAAADDRKSRTGSRKSHAERPQPDTTTRSRHIPSRTREEVMHRDGHRCTFVAPDGRRCTSTHDLQIDHVHPFALGGSNDPTNLRVLCGAHNRHRARKTFGTRVPRWNARE